MISSISKDETDPANIPLTLPSLDNLVKQLNDSVRSVEVDYKNVEQPPLPPANKQDEITYVAINKPLPPVNHEKIQYLNQDYKVNVKILR